MGRSAHSANSVLVRLNKYAVFFLFAFLWAVFPAKAQDQPEVPQKVYTGIYLMNIYDLNVSAYSFYADFYLWFRWKGDIDPTNIEFVNALEKWGFTVEPFYEEHKELEDGYLYNGMRIEGRFYHSFQLNEFPLDKHVLDIRMENIDYPADSLIYVPDTSRFLLREDFKIPGWNILGAKMATHNNAYRTNLGEPATASTVFSNFDFLLTISRPRSYFLLKLMLPLLVVLIASLGGLFIFPPHIDARSSLPIGGLLSCVFLQQSYSDALPDIGAMVLMDRIYLLSYLLIAAILLRIIVASNRLSQEGEAISNALFKVDRKQAAWFFLVFTMGVLFLVLIK